MDLRDVIIDDAERGIFRVHRSTMTSPEILELERERVFDRSWLYVGHETEVPNPGDYCRRTVGGRPIFFVRSSDGHVRVFLNTCTHRGAMVCRRDEGNAEVFQCFYHAWTFNNKGELIGIPDEAGYAEGFDRGERALRQPPRFENYRGFYFLSFNPEIEDLVTYLADARVLMDIFIDQGEQGVKVLRGSQRYMIRANWKLLVENSIDSYHVPTVHATYVQYLNSRGVRVVQTGGRAWGADLGNGHGAFSGQERTAGIYGQPAKRFSEDVQQQLARIRARLMERYRDELANWMPGRVNFLIYPNLIFIGTTTLRTLWPVSHDAVEVTAWMLAPKEDSGEALAERTRDVPLFQGPGGFATPDDTEALEACQAGFAAKEVEWSDISRGMHRFPLDTDEIQMRAFWRQWHAQMLGLPKAPRTDDLPVRIAQAGPASSQ